MRTLAPALLALITLQGSLHAAGTRRLWDFATYSSIRRVQAEPGAPPNGQPAVVDAATLTQLLGSVRFLVGSQEVPLFVPLELPALTGALEEALALAQPGEDLELVSARKRDQGFFAGTTAISARVFAREGRLNLIVHDTRQEFLIEYSQECRMPTFNHGSRTKVGAVILKAPGAESRRADWLALPLPASRPMAPAPMAGTHPPVLAAPQPTVEERLRDLKRFRDEGLVSDQDYEKQKQALLLQFQEHGNTSHLPSPAGTP